MKVRLLWVSHFPPYPPKGGALQRSYNMLKECSRFSEVTLLSLAPAAKVRSFYKDYEAGLEDIKGNLSAFCHDVKLIRHGRFNRLTSKVLYGLKSLFSRAPYDVVCLESREMELIFKKYMEEHKFDVVHIDTIGLYKYIDEKSGKTILNHHNIESDMLYRRANLSPWLLKVYMRWQGAKLRKLEKRCCDKVALNLVCSTLDQRRLNDLGIEAIEVVPNGVDLGYFTRKSVYNPENKGELVFAGGLSWYPNRDAMLFFIDQVWPSLANNSQGIGVVMNVVGKGSIKKLDELADKDENFKVLGFVDDVRTVLERVSIYVCPIRDGGGTKLKVLDALAMGVPLVATTLACEGIDVVDGKSVLIADTPSKMVDKILELIEDEELRRRLSIKGRELIEERYSYDFIGKEMSRIYLKIAARVGD